MIIAETIQAILIKFAVKIVPTKGLYNYCQSDDLDFHSRPHSASQTLPLFNLQYLGQYLIYYTQTWHDGRIMHGIYAHARFDDLELDIDFENVCRTCPTCLLCDLDLVARLA